MQLPLIIETYWIVKKKPSWETIVADLLIIETYWIVKTCTRGVKKSPGSAYNRNILDCKAPSQCPVRNPVFSYNRNILDCKVI